MCGQGPSNRRNFAPVRQTFAYTGRGNQEGTHAPLEGAPRPQVRVPTPGLYAMSRGVVPPMELQQPSLIGKGSDLFRRWAIRMFHVLIRQRHVVRQQRRVWVAGPSDGPVYLC